MYDRVISPREILIDDWRFPIVGGIRRTVISPFPAKITIGDYSKDDRITESSWVLSSFNGGMGIQYAQMPRDQERFWFGDLDTRYRHLTLGPRIIQHNATGANALFLGTFNKQLYCVTDTAIYRVSQANFTLVHTFDPTFGDPTALTEFDGGLVVQGSQALVWSTDGTTWTQKGSSPGEAAIVWDDKYIKIEANGQVAYLPATGTLATSMSAAWTTHGKLYLAPKACRQLIQFFDLTGELVVHAVTTTGLYGYDWASKRFYPTPLQFPLTYAAGSGAAVWRGEIYVPAGPSVYKYNGSTVQNVSPAKDDGLPKGLQGNIAQICAGHGFYFAVLQGVREQADTVTLDKTRSANALIKDIIDQQAETDGAVLCSPGTAWHALHYENEGATMGAAAVAATDEGYRLWFSTSDGLYYTDLSAELHNPLQNVTSEFKATGYVETPWVDMGSAEIPKLALYLEVFAHQMSNTSTIRVEAAYDYDEVYEEIGTVTTNGRTVLTIGSYEGKVFRNVKLRLWMARDTTTPKATPILRSASFVYFRRPEQVWGYQIQLQLTANWEGRSPEEMVHKLYELVEQKTASRFIYRDAVNEEVKEGRVIISRCVGAERGGTKADGSYTLSLIEVREPTDG